MSNVKEYLHTDWGAMTATDWVGMSITVIIFLLMVGLYFYVLRPKNRDALEAHRTIPMHDDRIDDGE